MKNDKFLINEFKNNFNYNILPTIDEIINIFNSNFMYGELWDLFKTKLNKKELKEILIRMGHDYIDLDMVNNNLKYY